MEKTSGAAAVGAGMTAREVLEAYFWETRCKLIEVAANLDRVDRAGARAEVEGDRRMKFIAEALKILESKAPNRAELVLRLWSLGVEGAVWDRKKD